MKYAIALLMALAGTVSVAQPALGATVRVYTPTAQRSGDHVVVRGRVSSNVTSVRVQKRVGGSWLTMSRPRVSQGRYDARVAAKASSRTVIRTVARTTSSRWAVVPPSDGCGTRPAKSDGSLWSCSFVDNFSGASLDRSKWVPQTQFATGVQAAHACYRDDPSVINQSGGTLNLTVRKVSTPVSCTFGGLTGPTDYLAGGVMTYRLFSQQYGRFEARIKNTATSYQGLHEAFWLWPDDRVASTAVWPAAGEIDVAETYSYYASLVIPFLHYGYGLLPTPGLNTAWSCAAQRGVFNTYTLTWAATRLEIKVNGRTCLVNTSGDAAFRKPYIMALTQALGAPGNVYDGRAPIPATMNVDYVKAWR